LEAIDADIGDRAGSRKMLSNIKVSLRTHVS
jgi:hypothetical protein